MMLLAALTGTEETIWFIILGIGLVVVAVVIALLTLLIRLVNYIDTGAAELWETATQLAANTATTWQLNATLENMHKLKNELALHDQLLGGSR